MIRISVQTLTVVCMAAVGIAQEPSVLPAWLDGSNSSLWGRFVTPTIDVNRDGVIDIAIGVPFISTETFRGGGVMFVSGRDLSVLEIARGPDRVVGYGLGVYEAPDLDGDGSNELFVAGHAGRITAYSPKKKTAVRQVTIRGAYGGLIGDWDRDGTFDFVVGGDIVSGAAGTSIGRMDPQHCALAIYREDVLGPFKKSPLEFAGSYSLAWSGMASRQSHCLAVGSSRAWGIDTQLAVADFNRDGHIDVVMAEPNPNAPETLITMSQDPVDTIKSVGGTVTDLMVIPDVDADGIPEVVGGSNDQFSGGAWAFSGQSRANLWGVKCGHGNVSLGLLPDLNGDGLPELCVGSGHFDRQNDIVAADGQVSIVSTRDGKVLATLTEAQVDPTLRQRH